MTRHEREARLTESIQTERVMASVAHHATQAERLRCSAWVGEEAARRSAICRSLAYAASNYYDELYLRTGNTAADSMEKLAEIFEAVWVNKHGDKAASSPTHVIPEQ